jgi:hypothetical protein
MKMTERERPEFLSRLLAFLAERRFFPDVGSVGGPVLFTVERDGLSYTVRCRSTGSGGRTTVYEIRRPLACSPAVADEAGLRGWMHLIRIFALLNAPFALGIDASGRAYLSCTGMHQGGAAYDFLGLHELFEARARQAETAVERLATLRPTLQEIDAMLVIIRDPKSAEADDAL